MAQPEVEVIVEEAANGKEEVNIQQEKDSEETLQSNIQLELAKLTQKERDIIRQIEYYFSEANLRRDKFMIGKTGENEGWVEISVLLTFNRLKAITEEVQAVADAMDKSPHGFVQVSDDKQKLRRHPDNPLPEFNEARRKEIQARTVYAKGLPLDSDLSTLIDFFNNNFEDVEQVAMRKYFCPTTKNHLFKGSVFVVFRSREAADKFIEKEELKYNEKPLLRYTQSKYFEVKKQERTEKENKKKNKKAQTKGGQEQSEPELSLPKQAVVHFAGVEGEVAREDIKAQINEMEASLEVAFIHFQRGDKEGDLRFKQEGDGKKFVEKLADGKLKVNDVELTFSLVEGEDEEKFLAKAVQEMKERRSNFQQRGNKKFGKRRHDNHGGHRHSKRAKVGGD